MLLGIGRFELTIYTLLWILANLYSIYELSRSQSEILQSKSIFKYPLSDLQPGWLFISRKQDVSDIEWTTWKFWYSLAWKYLLIQFVVSECLRRVAPFLLQYWYIILTCIFIVNNFGAKQLLVVSVQPILYTIITISGGKHLSLWITSTLLLISYNSLKYKEFFWDFFDHENLRNEEVYLSLISVGWIELRCISFSLDFIEKSEKSQDGKFNYSSWCQHLIKLFSYVFYLPLLYTGPLILYNDFERSFVVKRNLHSRIKRFLLDVAIFSLYTFLLDLAFHYIYFLAMQEKIQLIKKLPTIALCGGGLFMGLQFHMKYVISYGTAGAFASLDHMEPPPTPRCIARVHIYSQMWRFFDVGLYRFLIKYIYKPCFSMISKHTNAPTVVQKLMASFVTFLFIFLWHGTTWAIFFWSVLNYIGITCEHLGKVISQTDYYKYFRNHVLKTARMEQRFFALLCTPLLAMSAISNFYLFAGYEVGNIFFACFVNPSIRNSVIVILSLYSCCHVSMALEDMPSRTAYRHKASVL